MSIKLLCTQLLTIRMLLLININIFIRFSYYTPAIQWITL